MKHLYFIIFFSVTAALIISFLLGQSVSKPFFESKMENHQPGFKYISPLLDCENTQPLDFYYAKLKENIQNDISSEIKENNVNLVSLYLRDLNNGPWIGINEQEKFSPASLLKVPLMMAYLKIYENKPELLNEKYRVIDYGNETLSQNIPPSEKIKIGEEYSIADLISRTIKYSDNAAANTLLANIKRTDLEKIYSDLDLSVPSELSSENYMTITDYSTFFRILYNSSYLNKEMSEKALTILTGSNFKSGLNAKLPENVIVAHKFGERIFENKKQLHDCGIIYLNNNNYLLCIMTRGDDFKLMENAISDISKNIYDQMASFTNH